jgi:hypothetical protein
LQSSPAWTPFASIVKPIEKKSLPSNAFQFW